MASSAKFTLPVSVNARNIFDPVISSKVGQINTPVASTELTAKLPENIGDLRAANSKYLNTLTEMNRPIERFQGLMNNTSSVLNNGLNNIAMSTRYGAYMGSELSNKLQQATRLTGNLVGLNIVNNISPALANRVTALPASVMGMTNGVSNLIQGYSTAFSNVNIGMTAAALVLCGLFGSLLKSAINSLTSTALQLQRSVLAKIDSLSTEILNVIEKGFDQMLSLLPEVNVDWPIKNIQDKVKSVLAQISKITAAVNRIQKEAADCLAMAAGVLALMDLFDVQFGIGASDNLSNKGKITNSSNLGNIGNIQDYIRINHPNLLNETVLNQTKNNREGNDLENNQLENELLDNINKTKEDVSNSVLEETLNPELDDMIDNFYEAINDNYIDMKEVIDELLELAKHYHEKCVQGTLTEEERKKISCTQIKQLIDLLEELLKLLKDIHNNAIDIKDNMKNEFDKQVSENMNQLFDSLDKITEDVKQTMQEQREDMNVLFDSLEKEAELVDQLVPKTLEQEDTSCRT